MRFLFSICIGLILSGCTAVRTGNPAQLTLLTYNVRNAKGLDNQTNYDQTAAVIRGSGAGIVALQELDSATTRSKGSVVLDSLASKTGMHAVYGAAIEFQGGRYGVGLLSKEKPLRHYTVPLPGREEARVLLVAEFANRVVFCTHLSLTAEDRLASAAIINAEVQKFTNPVFLLGDLNATPEEGSIQELRKQWQQLSTNEFTFPADAPDRCIDYIFVRGGKFNVLSSSVIDEPLASDHRPVRVVVNDVQRKD